MRVNIIRLCLLFMASLEILIIFLLTRLRLVKDIRLEIYLLDLWEVLLALGLDLVHHKDPHWLSPSRVGTLVGKVVFGGRPISAGLVASSACIRWAWWPSACWRPARGTCRWPWRGS